MYIVMFLSLLVFIAMPPLIVGAILTAQGKRVDEKGQINTGKINAGWILILISIIQIVLYTIGVIIYEGLFAMILWLPLIVMVGLILTLAFGISTLIDGYHQHNKIKKSIGWTLLIINSVIVTTIVLLLLMFTTGIIPIRLM